MDSKRKKRTSKNDKKNKIENNNANMNTKDECENANMEPNGSDSGSSTDSEDLVNAMNYNTITSLAALKDILQGDNNDTPETDSFFQHYFMNHCNNLSSHNANSPTPFPYSERRRLSQCREEDEDDEKKDFHHHCPNGSPGTKSEKTSQTCNSASSKEHEMGTDSYLQRETSEEQSLSDNKDDVSEIDPSKRTVMGAKHKFLVTKAEQVPQNIFERALRTKVNNSHTVHFGTKGAEEQRPSVRAIFTGQNLHRDKKYFDSSLIEIRSTVDDTLTSSEDIWVKRSDDKKVSNINNEMK